MKVIESGFGEMIQPPDMDAFRAWNREKKSRKLVDKLMTEREAISRFVHDGCYIGTALYGTVRCPMSLVREVIRQGIKDLRVAGQGVLELDQWVAAGIVEALDITYAGMEVYGISKPFRREVESGRIRRLVEWSNGALSWRFKATAMGVPFLPVRTMLGTDTFRYSAAKAVECPFTGKKLALLPALILDVGLLHVHRADRHGNCQIDGITGFGFEFARACKRLIVSAEEIISTDEIRSYPDRTIVPYYLVDAVVHAPFGSHPGEMAYVYCRDEPEIKAWVEASQDEATAQAYLQTWVHDLADHQAYLDKVGETRLQELVEGREKRA